MSESQLEAGERRTAVDGDLLALSPRPVKTGAQPADSTDWVRRKNDIWMDLQGGNLIFAAEFSLMFLSLGILALALVGFLPSLITWSERGYFDWGMPLFILVGNIFCTLPFGLVFHLNTNKAIKEGPPIRLNRQKREIAIPHWVGGKAVAYPLWGATAFIVIYTFYTFMSFGWIATWIETPYSRGSVEMRGVLSTAFWISMVTAVPYLAIGLYLKLKNKSHLTYIYHPWEQIVAFIQKRQVTAPTILAEQTLLTLAVPDPDNPDSAKAAISINVGHETVGLPQWECLRAFMDEGPSACPDPRDYGTLADYKASCHQARQEKGTAGWLWKKVGDWFFQRYLARLITERRVRKLIPKTLPEQLKEWSESLPESEWVQPSEELRALNTQLTAAYRRGETFSNMGPVSQWLSGEHAKAGHITA